jgi:hypothetical protein
MTDDPDRAIKFMAYTAMSADRLKEQAGVKSTGRKLEKPVFVFSVAWHPEQTPDKEHMLETAQSAVSALGLAEHQLLFVSHNDEPQKHVHVIVNRVHPETGKAATLSKSKECLSRWALAYEKEHGKIYCQQRAENAHRREAPQRSEPVKYRDAVIAAAWRHSDSGKAFQTALKSEGYHLAQGRRCPVVVDRWGKAHNPVRHLEGVKTKDLRERLQDLDLEKLPQADELKVQIKKAARAHYHACRKWDRLCIKLRNESLDRQIKERGELGERLHLRRLEKEYRLREHYKVPDIERDVASLAKTAQRPSLLARLSGKAAVQKKELAALQSNLEQANERIAEELGSLDRERDEAFAKQQVRHEEEKGRLAALLEKQKPGTYREEHLELTASQERNPVRINSTHPRASGREI